MKRPTSTLFQQQAEILNHFFKGHHERDFLQMANRAPLQPPANWRWSADGLTLSRVKK